MYSAILAFPCMLVSFSTFTLKSYVSRVSLGQCVGIYEKQFSFLCYKPGGVNCSSPSFSSALTHLLEIIYELFPLLKPAQLTVRLSGPGAGTVDVYERTSQSFLSTSEGSYIDKSGCSRPNLIQHRPMDSPALYTSVCMCQT